VTVLDAVAILAAGAAAGTVNAVVGSGTLITFPVLLALGYPAVTANVSNAVGLTPGLLAGSLGYRAELAGERRRLLVFGAASLAGGTLGALLLLALPAAAFRAIVPVFIALAVVLILAQPLLRRLLDAHLHAPLPAVLAALFVCGVYGGYFGAAQGVLLLAILGFALPDRLQTANGIKNVLNLLTNLVAATVFVAVAHIAWGAAVLIACGSVVGGVVGARIGRRLPPWALRAVVVAVGAVAFARLALG
jgi:uncharacterized membrane protein YfcA